jgi:hypothetical protein
MAPRHWVWLWRHCQCNSAGGFARGSVPPILADNKLGVKQMKNSNDANPTLIQSHKGGKGAEGAKTQGKAKAGKGWSCTLALKM